MKSEIDQNVSDHVPSNVKSWPAHPAGRTRDTGAICGKNSVVITAIGTVYYLNLYRDLGRGPFVPLNMARLEALMPLLASPIRRHYSQAHPTALPASHEEAEALKPLTERERQLCLSLLRGHTLKTAAADLDIAISTAARHSSSMA